MINKLILGTAGLSGEPYGLAGRAVPFDDAVAVVGHALACGFTAIDTAPAYGQAERAIGVAIGRRNNPATAPRVYTKTKGDRDMALNSIEELGVFPAFLWHNWDSETTPLWAEGVTVYSHDACCWLPSGVIQCDWNIFNQSADCLGRSFIARSVFLQGLLMGDGGTRLAGEIRGATAIAHSLGVTLPDLALWAALNNPKITNVVVGCSSIDEIDTILRILEKPIWTSTGIKILHVGGPETDPRTWTA